MRHDPDIDFVAQRAQMVQEIIAGGDITDKAVIAALGKVPRHEFVQPVDWDEAYENHPLGIDCRQTISQPYIVALMSQYLRVFPGVRVLEIGTGSGYQAAVLAELGARVFSVERHTKLAQSAATVLERCGYGGSVTVINGDGSEGWAEHAPFERIILTCCAPEVPQPLRAQLAEGGILVAPVEDGGGQVLEVLRKENGKIIRKPGERVIFVRLIGKYGYSES